MTVFISGSKCAGRRPSHLVLDHYHSRNNLIAHMIQARHTVRFLVAPSSFGKTTLMDEYAHSIFGFNDVFWIRGQSPCFLRDLDNNAFTSCIFSLSNKPGLIIFDDVPRLSHQRAGIFSTLLDVLRENGWEVLVSMSPSCDRYAEHQSDRLLVSASDLLVSDFEMEQTQTTTELAQRTSIPHHSFERIPCFFWPNSKSSSERLKQFLQDELSTEVLLCVFVALLVQKGSIELLSRFVQNWSQELLLHLAEHYLYLGIDLQEEQFRSAPFAIEILSKEFLLQLDRMTSYSSCATKNELVAQLADILIEQGDPQRACQCMGKLSSVSERKAWLENNAQTLFQSACFYEAYQVYESFSLAAINQASALAAAQAWRLHFLGNNEDACRLATRVQQTSKATEKDQVTAALLLARYGNEAAQKTAQNHLDVLTKYSSSFNGCTFEEGIADLFDARPEAWHTVAVGYLCLQEGTERAMQGIAYLSPNSAIVALLSTWMLQDMCSLHKDTPLNANERNQGEKVIHQALEIFSEQERSLKRLSFLHVEWYRSLEQAMRVYSLSVPQVSKALSLLINEYELSLFEQQRCFAKAEKNIVKKQGYRTALQKEGESETTQDIPPILEVKFFGALEVRKENKVVEPTLFRRQKVKLLFAILVLSQGKEISREKLIEDLWPGHTPEAGRRNFYNIWSELNKILRNSSKDNPYLVRLQQSYKADMRYVSSDVAAFERLCQDLSFGSVDMTAWSQLYRHINVLYADNLLPGEYENEIITLLRDKYRKQMVDACVTAARRLLEHKNAEAALQFARRAVEYGSSREDAYEILMRAQIKLGQRTEACDTFFKCRAVLRDEFGITPSQTMATLHNEIICDDPNGSRLLEETL